MVGAMSPRLGLAELEVNAVKLGRKPTQRREANRAPRGWQSHARDRVQLLQGLWHAHTPSKPVGE